MVVKAVNELTPTMCEATLLQLGVLVLVRDSI